MALCDRSSGDIFIYVRVIHRNLGPNNSVNVDYRDLKSDNYNGSATRSFPRLLDYKHGCQI